MVHVCGGDAFVVTARGRKTKQPLLSSSEAWLLQ